MEYAKTGRMEKRRTESRSDYRLQGLQVARSKNIKRVLVTCDCDNAASRAVILTNGGALEDVRGGKERYWIDLD